MCTCTWASAKGGKRKKGTLTETVPILAGIQPAGLRRLEVILPLANRSILGPNYFLYDHLVRSLNAQQKKSKFRRPFVPAARKLLENPSELNIRVGQRTEFRCNMQY